MRVLTCVIALIVAAAIGSAQRAGPVLRDTQGPPADGTATARRTTLPDNVRASFERSRSELRAALEGLDAQTSAELQTVIGHLRAGRADPAMSRWERVVSSVVAGAVAVNVDGLIQWVLRRAYIDMNEDLQQYAEKLRHINDLKGQIRDHLAAMRQQHAEWTEAIRENGVAPDPVTVNEPVLAEQPGEVAKLAHRPRRIASQADWDAHLKLMEEQMQQMNRSYNLQYLQLQQQMQREARQMTLISNIMKTKHDTAKNAISSIR